ncbi:MAG TPA: glycoside hydrolase family 27 protein [Candidatus Acidoferrales bacterium]|nr:glycoside hydrolase family 27 protein [Candidatus Acidoferrales bacterium]
MKPARIIAWVCALSFICAIFAIAAPAKAQSKEPVPVPPNRLALTPPMGWNSWNKFACNVSESLIDSMADAMVSSGMKDAGYQYIVIDDCWQVSREASGKIVADPKRFPNGIKAVADYVHSKGLKFGIYSDAGTATCQGRPGGRGHEFQDALTYASWGVDYLKYDWCNTGTQDAAASYRTMAEALRASGRPIVFSICEWGKNKPWLWAAGVGGNLWRTTDDIQDRWSGRKQWPNDGCCSNGVLDILDQEAKLYSYAGPGHWNDPDMLEVGNGGMTADEDRAHFSLWCLLAAPLITGNDLRSMSAETKEILTNREVIAVDQDPLGQQGRRVGRRVVTESTGAVKQTIDTEVWSKELHDGGRAVILLNRGDSEMEISVDWNQIGYPDHLSAEVRDLWAHKDLGRFTGSFKATVPSHAVVMVTVKP